MVGLRVVDKLMDRIFLDRILGGVRVGVLLVLRKFLFSYGSVDFPPLCYLNAVKLAILRGLYCLLKEVMSFRRVLRGYWEFVYIDR